MSDALQSTRWRQRLTVRKVRAKSKQIETAAAFGDSVFCGSLAKWLNKGLMSAQSPIAYPSMSTRPAAAKSSTDPADRNVLSCAMRTCVIIVSHPRASQGVWCDDCVTPAGPSGCAV
eukprot:9411960-Pyramimonas_sp.AAC.1